MKLGKREYQTFGVSIVLLLVGVYILKWTYWGWLLIVIALMNFLGWEMDMYFKRKYGKETIAFGKETFGEFTKNDPTYVDMSPFAVHRRKIKEWWNKLWRKEDGN